MKKILPFLSAFVLLFISFVNTYAQRIGLDGAGNRKGHAAIKKYGMGAINLQTILQKQYLQRQEKQNAAAKTASVTAERLKAFCGYNYGDTVSGILFGGKSDSAYYVYSGQNGSVFNYQRMDYLAPSYGTNTSPVDVADWGSGVGFTYFPGTSVIQQSELYPDSAYVWNSYFPVSVIGADTFGYADIVDYYYSGHNITERGDQYYPAIGGEIEKYDYYYDGTGKLIFGLFFAYNTSSFSWDTTNAINFFYNGSGQLIMDSSSVNYGAGLWGEGDKEIITYNGAGYASFIEDFTDSSGSWIPNTDRFLYYNTDNTLHTDSVSQYNVGTWTPYIKDSFGYTPGVAYFTYGMTEEFIADSIYAKTIMAKHVSASGLPDTVYSQFYTIYASEPLRLYRAKKVSFTYDSYNNPTIANDYGYNIVDSIAGTGYYNAGTERVFYYYYETYEANAVKHITAADEQVIIYPNPATNEVTISRPDAIKGSYTTISLSNTLGQIIRTESLQWMNQTETFPLAGLASGVYVLTLQDKSGNTLTTQKIVKR